jgi:hypothetical protein
MRLVSAVGNKGIARIRALGSSCRESDSYAGGLQVGMRALALNAYSSRPKQ